MDGNTLSREIFDVLVIGAGPTGMACAIEAQRAGLRSVLVDKGCLCNSLFHYPSHMTFFTTPELLEIGDIPFPSVNQKPTRNEALEYYRKVAEHYQLDIRPYQNVDSQSPVRMAIFAFMSPIASSASLRIMHGSLLWRRGTTICPTISALQAKICRKCITTMTILILTMIWMFS